MNIAQSASRNWTPQVILLSILIHALLLYYVAVAFQVLPPIATDREEPPVIKTVTFQPPPPVAKPDDNPVVPETHKIHRPDNVRPTEVQSPPPSAPVATGNGTPAGDPTGVTNSNGPIGEAPVSRVQPNYPVIALNREVEGRVVLSITILPDGSVTDVRVVSAKPAGYFESSAVSAVQRWRYRPSNLTRTNVIVYVDYVLT